MSYEEYFEKNADPFSWETATPLHLLQNFCTLWLGASMKDWNMLRLLDAARNGRASLKSYCIQSLEEISPEKLALTQEQNTNASCPGREELQTLREIAMRFQATLFETVGLQLIIGGCTYGDIPATIRKHVTQALSQESTRLESGVIR